MKDEIVLFVEVLIPFGTLIFGAGATYFLIKQTRRDVNGVGRKTQQLEKAVMFLAEGDERKKMVIDILQGKG